MGRLSKFDIFLLVIFIILLIALVVGALTGRGSSRTMFKLVTLVLTYAVYFIRRLAKLKPQRQQLEEACAPMVGDAFLRDGRLRRRLVDAWTAYHLDQNDKALRLAKVLEPECIEPEETAAVYLLMCCIYEDKNDLPQALDAIRTAIWKTPDNPRLHVRLGRLLQAQGDTSGAESAFRDALDHDPEYAAAWSNLAGLCLTKARAQEAVEAAKKSLYYDPTLYASMGTLVLAYLIQGDTEASSYWMRRYSEHDPQGASAMAKVMKQLGEQAKE